MLPLLDPLGRIYILGNGVPVSWNNGVGYDSIGRMCTTGTLLATDQFVSGWRLDALGRLVVANAGGSVVYNGGLPFLAVDGRMVRILDAVPSANDPYVNGIRVSNAGAVYLTTAAPPALLSGFDSGFDGGFGT
jgi:hypothetical protein